MSESETANLLAGNTDYESIPQDVEDKPTSTYQTELKKITSSSLPLIVTFFLQYLLSVTSMFAASKLGSKELAAASLAICTFNITGLAIYEGTATCLDSFCSQAYGAKKYHLVGLYFQRCCFLMAAMTVPLGLIWWFSASILNLLIPGEEELTLMAQTYLRYILLGAPGLFFFEAGKRFLQAQHIFNASTYVLIVAAPLNIVLHWLLVWHPVYGIGFVGAPIAVTIIYWFMSLMLLSYVLFIDGKKCWDGLKIRESFADWSSMCSLAVPGIIMVESEYLAFEILTILAARFGTASLAAQSIAANIGSLAFQLQFAVAVATGTRMGNLIGGKKVKSAALVAKVAFLFAGIIAVFNFSYIAAFRYYLTVFFSTDPDVVKLSEKLLLITASLQFFDVYNTIGAGILRGQGRQRVGSVLNVICYYILSLPLGYVFAFIFKMELFGLWTGLIIGVITLSACEWTCIYFSNWDLILKESEERID